MVIAVVRNGWLCCPDCGQRLMKLHKDEIEIKCKGRNPNGDKCREIVTIKLK